MAIARKRGWLYALALIGGLVIGSFIGRLCMDSQYLWWLGYSLDFGFQLPKSVDIDIYLVHVTFSLGVWLHFSVASILGAAVAALICYRR